MKTHTRHIKQAKAEDFIIDMSAAGRPVGYRGPRHQPIEWCDCYTELETELFALIEKFTEFLEPMRFDRPSDDAKAVELDQEARRLLKL